MDPASILQGACLDAKRLRCSVPPDDPVSKVLADDNTNSCVAPVPPLDDDNILQEILIRLSPKPSSLPRASLVCTRWQSILTDHQFLKWFRKHHRKPPLLGFFAVCIYSTPVFTPILDSPDRIPASRFSVPQRYSCHKWWHFMGCRHGLAILLEVSLREAVMWNPLTGQQHHVKFPPGIGISEGYSLWHAGVLCSDAEDGHLHGDCILSPFILVLICVVRFTQAYACLYNSASGVWGDMIIYAQPSVLVRNTLCWLLSGGGILAFDLVRQSLGVIDKPAESHIAVYNYNCIKLLRSEDSGIVLAYLLELTIQLWERQLNCDGVIGWVLLQKTIQLEGHFPLIMQSDDKRVLIAGYDENTNVIVLSTAIGDFVLQLDSMQTRDIIKRDNIGHNTFYPYTNFYT